MILIEQVIKAFAENESLMISLRAIVAPGEQQSALQIGLRLSNSELRQLIRDVCSGKSLAEASDNLITTTSTSQDK